MITLCFIGYILISLFFTHIFKQPHQSKFGGWYEGFETRYALVAGFLVIPFIMILLLILKYVLVFSAVIIMYVIDTIGWIYNNMP